MRSDVSRTMPTLTEFGQVSPPHKEMLPPTLQCWGVINDNLEENRRQDLEWTPLIESIYMNPKYDRFGCKERIIGPSGIFPTMTCRYADAHCMSENQLQVKGLCGFAILEGTPLHPKRFAAPEEGCRAHGYCNLTISLTGDEREAYTPVGNSVTYAQGAWIGLLTKQVCLGAVCAHDMDVTCEHKHVMADQKARCRLMPVGTMRPRKIRGKVIKGVQNQSPRHEVVRRGRAIPLSQCRKNIASTADVK